MEIVRPTGNDIALMAGYLYEHEVPVHSEGLGKANTELTRTLITAGNPNVIFGTTVITEQLRHAWESVGTTEPERYPATVSPNMVRALSDAIHFVGFDSEKIDELFRDMYFLPRFSFNKAQLLRSALDQQRPAIDRIGLPSVPGSIRSEILDGMPNVSPILRVNVLHEALNVVRDPNYAHITTTLPESTQEVLDYLATCSGDPYPLDQVIETAHIRENSHLIACSSKFRRGFARTLATPS